MSLIIKGGCNVWYVYGCRLHIDVSVSLHKNASFSPLKKSVNIVGWAHNIGFTQQSTFAKLLILFLCRNTDSVDINPQQREKKSLALTDTPDKFCRYD